MIHAQVVCSKVIEPADTYLVLPGRGEMYVVCLVGLARVRVEALGM